MDFFEKLFASDLAIPSVLLGLAALLAVFLIVQAELHRKARAQMQQSLFRSQEKLFSGAAEQLAATLAEYAKGELAEQVNAGYRTLTSKELLPAVNKAAAVIADLSDAVVKRQEQGMDELAELLAERFSKKTHEIMEEQAAVISSMNRASALFSETLGSVSQTVEQLSLRYNEIYEQADLLTGVAGEAMERLGANFSAFGDSVDNAAKSVSGIEGQVLQSARTMDSISQTAGKIISSAEQSAALLATQNERTARLLEESAESMRQNAELSSKALLENLTDILGTAADRMAVTTEMLRGAATEIGDSVSQFEKGVLSSFEQFDSFTHEKISAAAKAASEVSEREYQNMKAGAEDYSNRFTAGIATLSETLEGHIQNLQTITRHLDNSLNSFKSDVGETSGRFELGMDKSVSGVLEELDAALAEIVSRLVSVTLSINEAADALPKAVKALKNQ